MRGADVLAAAVGRDAPVERTVVGREVDVRPEVDVLVREEVRSDGELRVLMSSDEREDTAWLVRRFAPHGLSVLRE